MIKELIKLANHLDGKGFAKEADYLDGMIRVASERKTFTSHYDEKTGELLPTWEWKKRNPHPNEGELMNKYNIQNEEDFYDDSHLQREYQGMWSLYNAQVEKNKALHLAKEEDGIREELEALTEQLNKELGSGGDPQIDLLNRIQTFAGKLAQVLEHSGNQEQATNRANQEVYNHWHDNLSPDRQQQEDANQAQQDRYEMHRNEY